MTHPEYFSTASTTDPAVTVSKDAEAALVFEALGAVAEQSGPVLVLGEPGTGRGAVARKIHRLSLLSDAPMIEFDCCDLDSLSCVRSSGRGLVFLREVDDLDRRMQAELADMLRSPLDGRRIVVSGSPGLAGMALQGAFSGVLLAAVSRTSLHVPPLRDRSIDVPDLVAFMLERYCAEHGAPVRLAEAAMGYLIDYDWPGNIAELNHVVGRLCEAARGDFVSADDLPPQIRWFPGNRGPQGACSKGEVGFSPLAEEFQFRLIADALRRTQRR